MASFINRFLLGNQSFRSETERMQAILLGQLAFVSAGICLVYLIADPIDGLYSFVQWYLLGVVISLIVVIVNRAGYYLTAASILMSVSIAILFVIAYAGDPNRGVYFYFVSASITSLVFFYNRSILLAVGFVILNLIAGSTAYLVESPFQETSEVTEEALKFRFLMNFIMATFSGVVAILFMIWRNRASESSLIASNKKLEETTKSLISSKNRFQRAVTGTRAGIYEWNITKDEVKVSSRWKQLLGYDISADPIVNLDYFMGLVHPDDIERSYGDFQTILDKGGTYQNELRIRLSTGEYRWFMDSGIIEREGGKPVLAVGSIIDINDRKIAEAELVNKNRELQKANDELDRFVYSASHDMRAPLATLLGLIEVIKLSENPAEYQRYFDMMISRINDMEGFIAEVTDYSRNTRLVVNRKPVKLLDLISKVKDSFYTLAEQVDIKIKTDVDKNLIINTDETRLKVVLNNLLANAIKYNTSEGEKFVLIKARKEHNDVIIEVSDNGQGIPKEFQANIFDMFFRASEDSSGSGLGLYIVKETLDKLNGEISFISKAREGTTFTIRIPQVS